MEVRKDGCYPVIAYIFRLNIIFIFFFGLVMQVTPKTLADVKGGTLISYEGRVQVCIN